MIIYITGRRLVSVIFWDERKSNKVLQVQQRKAKKWVESKFVAALPKPTLFFSSVRTERCAG